MTTPTSMLLSATLSGAGTGVGDGVAVGVGVGSGWTASGYGSFAKPCPPSVVGAGFALLLGVVLEVLGHLGRSVVRVQLLH